MTKNNWISTNTHVKTLYADRKSFKSAENQTHFCTLKIKGQDYYCNGKKIQTRFRSVVSDQNRRSHFEMMELEKQVLKSIFESQRLSVTRRRHRRARLSLYALEGRGLKKSIKSRGTITKVRNRCVITGRSSIVGMTGLSRIKFRQYAGAKKIPGLLKL